MDASIKPPYKFRRGEAGIFVEIYLPKKPNFQGTLYDTLVKGFRIANVVDHFKDPHKAPGIKEMLERYKDSVRFLESREEIDAFPSVLHGYSMYEVDGVFYNSARDEIQNDHTQVVRIMFRPDLANLLEKYKADEEAVKIINRTTKDYLRYPSNRDDFKAARNLTPMQDEVVDQLQRWVNYVGLFLFGFIVYEICEQITRLCSLGQMKWDDAEDEIWVTSLWNLVVNPIKLVRPLDQSADVPTDAA